MAWDHDAASNDYHRLSGEAHEHLAIIEALLAADRGCAAKAMSKHILSGLKYWSRALPTTRLNTPATTKSNGRTVSRKRSATGLAGT
jgi:DNA-binding GntR family transcriptional regulator